MTQKTTNHIALALDNSGSMSRIRDAAKNAYNSVLSEIQRNASATGQKTLVTQILFGDSAVLTDSAREAAVVRPLVDYLPRESTALWDGVGLAIETLPKHASPEEDNAFLVIVVTDGYENNSLVFDSGKLSTLIGQKYATGRWTFTFQVPRGSTSLITGPLGIPAGNVREWEQTEEGARDVGRSTSFGTQTFYAARSAGKTKVDDFYVNTNLKATPKQVAAKLDDISDRFNLYEVRAEEPIKPLVERRTRKPYVMGSAYYLLTKTETIQPQKSVLVMSKGKKAVWGGQQARDLIGLPQGRTCKATPGNHGEYNIFIQSTSTNRRLPRGTKVLVDTSHLTPSKGTWETA